MSKESDHWNYFWGQAYNGCQEVKMLGTIKPNISIRLPSYVPQSAKYNTLKNTELMATAKHITQKLYEANEFKLPSKALMMNMTTDDLLLLSQKLRKAYGQKV